jgi:HK97 gp10 family phage protein
VTQIIGNFEEVEAAFLAIIPRVEAADEAVPEGAARIIAVEAAARAPVLTGALQASVSEEGAEVVVDSDYAGYQEYGTRRNAAQPFLRPAQAASEPVILAEAETAYTIATR